MALMTAAYNPTAVPLLPDGEQRSTYLLRWTEPNYGTRSIYEGGKKEKTHTKESRECDQHMVSVLAGSS